MHAGDRRDAGLRLGQRLLHLFALAVGDLQADKGGDERQAVGDAMVDFGQQDLRPFLAEPDLLVGLFLGLPQLGIGDGLAQRAFHQRPEFLADRLDDIVGSTALQRLDGDGRLA